MATTLSLPNLPDEGGAGGELIVHNGDSAGSRRTLLVPLTLIGETGCDLCLPGEGIAPLHCAIISDPVGAVLRDFSGGRTTLNGRVVTTARLSTGDILKIGSVELFVSLPSPATGEIPVASDQATDQDALRIQAAAVAAQQAGLLEEEARLNHRATALQRQEQQLANHLRERQQRLEEQQEQLRQERVAFKSECAATRQQLEAQTQELQNRRTEIEHDREQATRQRHRLVLLRRRLRQRLRAELARVENRENAVNARRQELQRERAVVKAFQERINGEHELARQQLREQWQQLGLAQQQWEVTLNQEQAERERQRRNLEQHAAAVGKATRQLETEQKKWEQRLPLLRREAEGLEARIANLRLRLNDVRPPVANPPSLVPGEPILSLTPVQQLGQVSTPLAQVAEEIADQRSHLARQWEQLLALQLSWQQERAAALGEIEQAAGRLEKRERELSAFQQSLVNARHDLVTRQEALARLRMSLEGWQARLAASDAAWQHERGTALADLDQRERALTRRTRLLEDVQHRRNQRRQSERAEAADDRTRCDELRRQYSDLWQECQRQRESLVQQERALAAQAKAIEQLRQETICQTDHPAQAEARLEKLRRQEQARQEAAGRELSVARQALLDEMARMDARMVRLRLHEEDLCTRQADLHRQVQEWETYQASGEDEEERRQDELRKLRAQKALDDRMLRGLREEIERLARSLIDESDVLPEQQAA